MAATIVCVLFLVAATFLLGSDGQEFSPITENVALRALYKLEVFAAYNLKSETELQEEYQYNLASSRVELRRQYSQQQPSEKSVYLYDGINRRDVEIIGWQKLDRAEGLQLEENGGSSSYVSGSGGKGLGPDGEDRPVNNNNNNINNNMKVRLLTVDSLDEIIFKWNTTKDETVRMQPSRLDLSAFLTNWCLEKVNLKLKHIRGLSRLLHLIECRRKEFSLDHQAAAGGSFTRGAQKYIYRATNLPALTEIRDDCVHWLNITVSIIYDNQAIALTPEAAQSLPERALPTSLSLEFGSINMIINVYQLEAVDARAHLSESASSESNFMLPLAAAAAAGNGFDLARDLTSARSIPPSSLPSKLKQQMPPKFGFRALLSSSSRIPLVDPVELSVAYDGSMRKLARQMSIVDRSQVVSAGDAYLRRTTRLLFDGQTKIKYHVMHSNDDYVAGLDEGGGQSANWNDCASDKLSLQEEEALEGVLLDEAFDLDTAAFMGMALVRGIPCFVYERQLHHLPIWLGLGDAFELTNFDSMARLKATIYVGAGEIASGSNMSQISSDNQAKASKLYRIIFTALVDNLPRENMSQPKITRLSFNLEIFDFDWSLRLAEEELPDLFHVGQDCLFSQPDARYLKMKLHLEFVAKPEMVKEDSLSSRVESVSRALSVSLGIAHSQQANLETKYWPPTGSVEAVEAKLEVYELPRFSVHSQFLGHARDLSWGAAKTGGWSVGAASLSLDECQWRTVHQLSLPASANICHDHRKECHRIFMFCPASLHCVISPGGEDVDPKWAQLESMEPTVIESVLMFPERDGNRTIQQKCSLMSVELSRTQQSSHQANAGESYSGELATSGVGLEWMLAQKISLQSRLVELGGNRMKISSLSLSNIVEAGGAEEGLVIEGLGYDPPTTSAAGDPINFSLKVASVAHCSRACFINHACLSYSICHRGLHLECQLTGVNWTDASQVNNLRKLAQSPVSIVKSKSIEMKQIQLEDDRQVALRLKRSSLCSIYGNQHLGLYRQVESTAAIGQDDSNLLSVNSSEHCARYCMTRAYLLASLQEDLPVSGTNFVEDQKDSNRHCTSFRFSREWSICQLLPLQEINIKQFSNQPNLDSHAMVEFNKWRRSLEKVKCKMIPRYVEADGYELLYEQLFNIHQHQHLIISKIGNTSALQTKFINTGFHRCAELCLRRATCKSFDLLSQSTVSKYQRFDLDSGPRVDTCFLNSFSLADVSQQRDDVHLVVRNRSDDSLWWHYEFNDLALHIAGKLPVSDYNPPSSDGIFLNVLPFKTQQTQGFSGDRQEVKSSGLLNFSALIWALALVLVLGGLAVYYRRR